MEFLAARARTNAVVSYAFDLKVFFGVVGKKPVEVTSGDVLAFISDQAKPPRETWCVLLMVRLGYRLGRSRRRLSVSGFYG